MNNDVLNKTVAELIQRHAGDFGAIQADLINRCMKDHELLLALTAPHLKGVSAYAIQSIAKLIASGKLTPSGTETGKSRGKPLPLDKATVEKLGLEMLKNMAMGKPAKFGLEKAEALGGPRSASEEHIKAIHKIARKQS